MLVYNVFHAGLDKRSRKRRGRRKGRGSAQHPFSQSKKKESALPWNIAGRADFITFRRDRNKLNKRKAIFMSVFVVKMMHINNNAYHYIQNVVQISDFSLFTWMRIKQCSVTLVCLTCSLCLLKSWLITLWGVIKFISARLHIGTTVSSSFHFELDRCYFRTHKMDALEKQLTSIFYSFWAWSVWSLLFFFLIWEAA